MADLSVVDLSCLQFAITTLFHILWPVLSIGLSLFLVVTESLWLHTVEVAWYHHTRFWGRLFLLNFGVGVVTGIPLEFEFGTNWASFSKIAGGFFGNILGFEGAMAFMLEAGFLGIMMFGWQRVPRAMHLFVTAMVALGASTSAFWILVANSWMQTPAGGHMESGQFSCRLCDRTQLALSAYHRDDLRLDFPRRRLRIPRAFDAPAALGLCLRAWKLRCSAVPGLHARRPHREAGPARRGQCATGARWSRSTAKNSRSIGA
jgi:Cytochrome bd terminal oxidase subunit I